MWRTLNKNQSTCEVIRTLTIRSCVPSEEMMVPLSPTSDGRVWDIQLVTMAMVLSTAPIFNMGTLILTPSHSTNTHWETQLCSHTQTKVLKAAILKKQQLHDMMPQVKKKKNTAHTHAELSLLFQKKKKSRSPHC